MHMDASPESWAPEVESEDDDNFTDQDGLDSANLLVDDHDTGTSSQETMSADVTQKLIDLSALVPGSNKIDEVSVISETIKYIKVLHETIILLEDKAGIEHDEAVPENNKTEVSIDKDVSDITSNCKIEENNNTGHEISTCREVLPEIEARFSNKEVLVRIHCMRSKGLIVDILKHLEHLHLSVTRNSVLHFGDSRFEISIIAQMEDGFIMTANELARSLKTTVFPSI